jgi:hypothetical protein
VSNRDDEHDEAVVLDRGDDAVVADPITPQALEVAGKRVTETARVLLGSDPLAQKAQDATLRLDIELAQVACGVTIEFRCAGTFVQRDFETARSSVSSATRGARRASRRRARW